MLYFITETYLKVNTPITANVDVTDVTPYIATQAALRVQPILGTTFNNYMLTQYNAQALNPDEVDFGGVYSTCNSMEICRGCCFWLNLPT
jgi:hypothetical protein